MSIKNFWRSKNNIPRRGFWFIVRKLIVRMRLFAVSIPEQEKNMKIIGLNRADGLTKLDSVLQALFGKKYDETDGMFSEHLILLASISVSNITISKILEIGTYDGRTALILSKLFPESSILTIDLPINKKEFESTYNRGKKINSFVINRTTNLDNAPNVELKEINSLGLSLFEEAFDLIWIDGAHGYPVVAMDIINSFRLASDGGYVLIDDIWKSVKISDKMYKSISGLESLQSLVDAHLISSFSLFPKRLRGDFNYPGKKKFVGLFIKTPPKY